LDSLGFPWILSFESSLFNGLRGINRGGFFLALFPLTFEATRVSQAEAVPKRQILHEASLTHLLIFRKRLQALIALAVGGRSISSNFRFSVMAGLDLAIHENTECGDQVIDNVF
jgi:hypothetical protein